MKTKIITGLKKEVLVIELPKYWDYEIIDDYKTFLYHPTEQNSNDKTISGYEILGKPDEIKEEDAETLVEKIQYGGIWYATKEQELNCKSFETALESFHSALESEIFWENPLANEIHAPDIEEWYEAQEKTFDKKRTLIFVKD